MTAPLTPPESPPATPLHSADRSRVGGTVEALPFEDAVRVVEAILDEVCRAVVGKRDVVRLILAGLIADGHVLLDDVPGVAKTLTARSIAAAAGLTFSRVQFTPDLLPADITGSLVLDPAAQRPEFRPGPVFTDLLLADEVNRAPAKTQAALLEAMQERQVTADGVAHKLPRPFLVIATQNPIESEGTYQLPEAQLDRFLVRTTMGYPSETDELALLAERVERRTDEVSLSPACDVRIFLALQQSLEDIHFDSRLLAYCVALVRATRSDPRLPAYLIAGFGALVAAVVTGRHELAALGAPFVALAAIGLGDRTLAGVRAGLVLQRDRVIEGDVVDGEARIDWDGVAEVDVVLAARHGVAPVDPTPVVGWSMNARRGPVTLPFRLRAQLWGLHEVGTLWVRVRRPGGLLIWEEKLPAGPTLRVLPAPLRLDHLFELTEPHAVAGTHISRLRGHGTDFAELRPYRPGDRMRDLSWATSARFGKPWVAVRHSERTGTVLLLLDAFFSNDRTGAEALARAARAAWAIAAAHLKAQDRVGLLARGRTTVWLPPQGGRRARWSVLDELLAVGGAAEDDWQPPRRSGRVVVPGDALIIGVTSLGWQSFIRDLMHYRRVGHTTAALVIDASDLLPRGRRPLDAAALRIWLARREAERHALERGGIPTALVKPQDGVRPAVSTLRRRINALQAKRSGARAR